MLKAERQQKIVNIVEKEKRVIASELSDKFKVSEDTIRRDLKELDRQGLVRRVHSGALRVGPPVTNFQNRQSISSETKSNLAKRALSFLKEGSTILIDSGTTNLQLAKQIPIEFHGTLITNSPPIAVALEQHKHLEVIVLGGILYKESMVNLGIDTIESLRLMRADIYVMGIHNIDAEMGISVPTLTEAQVKRLMTEISTECIGMVTKDKIGTVSKNIVTPADELSYLITENADKEIVQEFSDRSINVYNLSTQ